MLRETIERDRVTPLILALIDVYQAIMPVVYTDLGLRALSQVVLDLAAREVSDE